MRWRERGSSRWRSPFGTNVATVSTPRDAVALNKIDLEVENVAKLKEKELVHWFKVAVASDPADGMPAHEATAALSAVAGVTDVDFLRTTMRTKSDAS